MASAKQLVLAVLKALPDDCSLEDVQYELYVRQKVAQGERAADAGESCLTRTWSVRRARGFENCSLDLAGPTGSLECGFVFGPRCAGSRGSRPLARRVGGRRVLTSRFLRSRTDRTRARFPTARTPGEWIPPRVPRSCRSRDSPAASQPSGHRPSLEAKSHSLSPVPVHDASRAEAGESGRHLIAAPRERREPVDTRAVGRPPRSPRAAPGPIAYLPAGRWRRL